MSPTDLEKIVNTIDNATPAELREAIATFNERGADHSQSMSLRPLYRDLANLLKRHLDR